MTIAHQARALVATTHRPEGPSAPWIAVAGGKGGVGKTLLAVNLALLAARSGYRTLLADLDPGLGNVDVHLRLAPRFTVDDLAADRCCVHEALVQGPAGLAILAGRSGSTSMATGGYALVRTHDAVARAARGFDLVICDTGAGIGPAVMETVAKADVTVTVTTPDPASVTDTYALIKLMLQADQPMPRLVLNRVRDREHALRHVAKLSGITQRFLGHDLQCAGWLRTDAALERSIVEQRPYATAGEGSTLEELRAITSALLSRTPRLTRKKVANLTAATAAG